MNPKTFLSKTTSVVASLVLAIGGSLIAAQPAGAVDRTTASFATTPQSGSGSISISIASCTINSFANPTPTPQTTDFTVTVNGSPVTVAAVNLGSFIALSLNSPLSSGQTLSVSYTKSSTSANQIPCTTSGDFVGSFSGLSATVTVGGGGGGPVTYTNTVAATFTMTSGVATYTAGTWTASDSSTPTISFLWLFCDSSHTAANGSNGQSSPPSDCGPIAATDISGQSAGNSWIKTTTLSIPATAFKWVSSNGQTVTVASANLNTKHIAVYENAGGTWKMSATSAVTETAGGSSNNVTAAVERYVAPVPALQAPILNSLAPKLATGFTAGSGKLVLKDVKPTDIKTVTLNGVAVTVTTTKSGTAIKLPAGATSGDLKFTMADGTVVDVAGVKVAPSQVNSNLVDLIPLAATYKSATSVAVPAAIKSAITNRAGIIAQSDMAKCVGYASSNTASARATALSRAANVCGIITDINEAIEPIIKVVVNKTVAKKTPVKYQTW